MQRSLSVSGVGTRTAASRSRQCAILGRVRDVLSSGSSSRLGAARCTAAPPPHVARSAAPAAGTKAAAEGMLPTRRAAMIGAGAAALVAAAAPAAPALAAPAACEVQTAPSGLQWCDLREGDGPAPIKGAFYKVHYRASLGSSGVEFDSSYAKKQPLILKFGEREVMEAWDLACLGGDGVPPMHEGGLRRIVVPPGPLQQQGTKSLVWMVGLLDALEEAGELPREGVPTADLVFEIELLKRRTR